MATVTVVESVEIPPEAADGDEPRYEVVDGCHVEVLRMGPKAAILATRLNTAVGVYGQAQQLGQTGIGALFGLTPKLSRRPDLAFVSYERWPANKCLPDTDSWPVIPNLAVEVISPHKKASELLTKIREYFTAGVQLVWVVFPSHQVVHVYETFKKIQVLTCEDTLDGRTVLPGFSLPLVSLFRESPS